MIEASDDLFSGLARAAKRKLGFSIDPHHFAILGRCADCEAARAPVDRDPLVGTVRRSDDRAGGRPGRNRTPRRRRLRGGRGGAGAALSAPPGHRGRDRKGAHRRRRRRAVAHPGRRRPSPSSVDAAPCRRRAVSSYTHLRLLDRAAVSPEPVPTGCSSASWPPGTAGTSSCTRRSTMGRASLEELGLGAGAYPRRGRGRGRRPGRVRARGVVHPPHGSAAAWSCPRRSGRPPAGPGDRGLAGGAGDQDRRRAARAAARRRPPDLGGPGGGPDPGAGRTDLRQDAGRARCRRAACHRARTSTGPGPFDIETGHRQAPGPSST